MGLAVVRLWQTWRGTAKNATGFWQYASILLTFHFVSFAWIFFRVGGFRNGVGDPGEHRLTYHFFCECIGEGCGPILGIGIAAHYVPKKWYDFSLNLYVRAPFYAQAAALAALVIGLQYVGQTGAAPFIYQKF